MQQRSGIPTVAELDELKRTDTYNRHITYNREFLARHGAALEKYGKHWGMDPFKLWSRRWEYPFVASRLIRFGQTDPRSQQKLDILDAGSGVTYFPYFICSQVPQVKFVCVDYDETYVPMFEQINRTEESIAVDSGSKVKFVKASLQKLPLADGALDAICCISVLEHTDNYAQIVDEFLRVLRPGGLFVLTFDLSLDGKFTLPLPQAEQLLKTLQSKFDVSPGEDCFPELKRMHDAGVLTSDHVRATEPELLPWTFPVRVYKAAQDLVKGKGWTAGFRSRTVVCCEVRKPG